MPSDANRRGEAVSGLPARPHLLHVFPSFGFGGVPIRIASIMTHFGRRFRHSILALDGCIDSASRLDDGLDIRFPTLSIDKSRALSNLWRFRRFLKGCRPDLLITYNWGAIEWALVNSVFPICRHVHMESGFGVEEAVGQLRRRVLLRRLALRRTAQIVVPSSGLVALATGPWRCAPGRVTYIPNGVDCARFAAPPDTGAIPGFSKSPGEFVVGTVAPLRPEKNLSRLVRAFAPLANDHDARLVIVGDGVEKPKLMALAEQLGVADRVVFAGHIEAVERVLGWFDVFALSSDTEQMPNAVLQAMAAGLPVVGTDVGDVKLMLAAENRPFVAPLDDDDRFRAALAALLAQPERRAELGRRNQGHVRAEYSAEKMFRSYEAVFQC